MKKFASKLGYDLSDYDGYNTAQLREILNGMISMVDYNYYADINIPAYMMKAIRKCLEVNANPENYKNWIDLRRLYKSRDINYTKYREKMLWEAKGVKFSCNYVRFNIWQLRFIWIGKSLGLDTSPLEDFRLGPEKAKLILLDLIDNIKLADVDYLKFSADQLDIIDKVIREGKDPSIFYARDYPASKMCVLKDALNQGIDLSEYANDYDSCQMEQILYGKLHNLDLSKYCYSNYSARKMQSIIKAMEAGSDISYVDENTYWFDIR